MFWLIILGVIAIVLIVDSNRNTKIQQAVGTNNRQWVEFLMSAYHLAKTNTEKVAIANMLRALRMQGMPVTDEQLAYLDGHGQHSEQPVAVAAAPAYQPSPPPPAPTRTQVQLDNASLLLYFGAFLFVAAAGLFVAFGGASGVLRAFIVLFVMLAMYGSGIWLYRNRPKLKQAGQAFAGIGIVLAPLVGAAWYSYVFNESNGTWVWFGTSLLCLALYFHALNVFRTTLMGYVLVFTFLSLFESGVGIADAPLYYFGWGVAVVGIGLQLMAGRWRKWKELQESSRTSAKLLLPVSVLVSLALIGEQGVAQLGVSLLFAAMFYALEFKQTTGVERLTNALASQITGLIGIASLTYGATENWLIVALALMTASIVQALAVGMIGRQNQVWHNFGSVALVTSAVAVLTSIDQSVYLSVALLVSVITAAVVWLSQKRGEAYVCGILAWAALPYVLGQLVIEPELTAASQTVLGGLSLLTIWATQLLRQPAIKGWSIYAVLGYVTTASGLLICATLAGPMIAVAAAIAVAVSMLGLAELSRRPLLAEIATAFLAFAAIQAWRSPSAFLLIVLVGLVYGILTSLRYRRDSLRWFGTVAWLVLPFALAHSSVLVDWTSATYAWAYLAVMFGLLLSRAIARGVWFMSSKIPIVSYARSASLSYVVGYVVAASAALIASLGSDNSQLHTSLILVALCLTVVFTARIIEKRNDVLALLPVLLQALLISVMRPEYAGESLHIFVLFSSTLAVLSYMFTTEFSQENKGAFEDARQSALVTAFIAPATVLFADQTSWAMPLGLLIAGILCLHFARKASQGVRELIGAVCTIAIAWFMGLFGVREFQAYTHLVVANLGLYAYLRAQRGEKEQTDQYLWCMLVAATVPLTLQALGSESPTYGLILLLEQVAIMLLGMTINKKFVTRWGLYVAVGAVLYQLRGLGYAALAVLALFLIGLAVFQLQKHGNDNQD